MRRLTSMSAKAPTARTCRRRTLTLKRLRAFVEAYAPGPMLLSEANQWPEDVRPYFGDGDEFHMNFHFPFMPRIFMAWQKAIARRIDRDSAQDAAIYRRTANGPHSCATMMS